MRMNNSFTIIKQLVTIMIKSPYHIVQGRPWPLITRMAVWLTVISLTLWIHSAQFIWVVAGLILIITRVWVWWWDVSEESIYLGHHRTKVQEAISWGIVLFIRSEVIFFSAFFWSFFHRRLAPPIEVGITWPPSGLTPLNPYEVPLLNTTILLTSGIRVTSSHHSIINNNLTPAKNTLILTIILGAIFTILQRAEYINTEFGIRDRVYGSVFYVATGFHGLHVLIGTTFLLVVYTRLNSIKLSSSHHFRFEAAAWYWHFVDVVWIFHAWVTL